ncbi:MAG: deoxyguanosinetriphosphate triphosphohydrolase [Acidobacteriota bacterium]|nr:deoxyguanosinetriphosphate triphosphohydrolase [Acidobacteriota bacterium]
MRYPIRTGIERMEHERLSEFAAKADQSRGRERPEEPCPMRTAFQRDRDRIIHQCKSFRRLAGKTQVFLPATGDHLRTRLTHTLEVSQIARTIARGLRVNEDLAEAIALAHDLGHTPFGHIGERGLDSALREYVPDGRFRHYEQSLRVVDRLERDGQGVNLSWEVRDGILHHSNGTTDTPHRLDGPEPATVEAKIVRWADRIAYVNHDLDDARRAGLLALSDVPAGIVEVLGATHGDRITTLVGSVIERSEGLPYLEMDPAVAQAMDGLKDFLFERVYAPRGSGHEPEARGQRMVIELFRLFMEEPVRAPYLRPHERDLSVEERALRTADFIAGMTDRYACDTYVRHFIPAPRGEFPLFD